MKKRNLPPVMFLLILIAAGGIFKVAGKVRPVDIVQLTGCGACIGVAIMMGVVMRHSSRGE